jgi:hypothetical protein
LTLFSLTKWCKIAPKKLKEDYSFVDSEKFHQIWLHLQKEFTTFKQVSSFKSGIFAEFSIVSIDARYFLEWWALVLHHQNGPKKAGEDPTAHGFWEIWTLLGPELGTAGNWQACGFSHRTPNWLLSKCR